MVRRAHTRTFQDYVEYLDTRHGLKPRQLFQKQHKHWVHAAAAQQQPLCSTA